MKKLNNKGFTIIELTLSFMFVFTLAFSMYQLLYNYRIKQSEASIESEMISFRDDVTLTIQTDITELTLKDIEYCTDSSGNTVNTCLVLYFNDASQTSKELKVVTDTVTYDGEDIEVNYISYDGVIFDEPDPILLEYKSGYILYSTYSANNLEDENVTIYRISIPIYHSDLDEDYGINIVAVGYDYNYDPDAVAITTLANKILLDETGESSVNLAEASIVAKGTPDFSKTATTDEGMYAATDDYGTSYYFRGAVEDNYVSFAGYIWRVVRINGDGSVRMIYDGTSAHANGTSSTDRYYKTSAFNSNYYSNAYAGYMYGDASLEKSVTTSTSTITLQSYYYYYGDSYTFDESAGYYTLTSPTQQIWNSSLTGYYTCRSTSTTCTTIYYIDSYTNMYQGEYYTYTRSGSSGAYTENHGTTTTTGTFAIRYYYGTGYSFNSTTGLYTLTGYAYNVYDGTETLSQLKGYYTCGGASYSSCSTIYYIDSYSSATVANVYTYTSASTKTYEETHANTTNSTIKTVIDGFYTSKLDSTTTVDSDGNKYSAYLSDTLFCNDRSVYSGTGLGKVVTYYYGYNRLSINKSPSLICTNQNDEFTVSETTLEDGTTVGNGDLTYPIGLITADEVAIAGGTTGSNTSYYLYIGSYYWTMTPYRFTGTSDNEFYVALSGYISLDYVYVSRGVRPVVNLSSEVLVESGTGTKDDPYTVKLSD